MSWRAGLTLLLLLTALVSGWSAWRQRAEPARSVESSSRPDYLLHDFELVSLDGDGKESFTLRAPELARAPADGTISLRTPLFLLPDPDGSYWEVRSRTGWLSADHDELRLRGKVVAKSAPDSPREVRMNTQQLNVFPQTNLANSPVPVTITQSGSTMRGSSMQANLASKTIKLKNVRTRYVPTRR